VLMETLFVPPASEAVPRRSRRGREDETRLFVRYRRTGDPAARAELVERFLPLARHLANHYRERGEYDDLVQVASYALVKAIDRYDVDRGLAFSSFAVPTIVGELKRYFRDHSWAVRVPRDLKDRALAVSRASERLGARLGRSPTPAELASVLDTSVELVLEALQTASALHPDRLDAPIDAGNGEREHPGVAAEEPGYAIAEASATLEPLLAQLTPREREVLRLRFEEDLTQSGIGAQVGISQMHVSRVTRNAIAKLQQLADNRPSASSRNSVTTSGPAMNAACGRPPLAST
jgi:RNA polymerase sigma-B factor